jgi:hypothetical protein
MGNKYLIILEVSNRILSKQFEFIRGKALMHME